MTLASESERVGDGPLSTPDRIRRAALTSFAAHGTAATTMRGVASAAGVSLGLVQHHFATKAGLIKVVDDYVLALVVTELGQPMPDLPADSVAEIGDRVTRIFTEHPDVAGYVGRAMVDGSALGATLFDSLMEVGLKRWTFRAERGEIRPDVDLTWAAINGLVLGLGAVSLRPHVERHLPEPLTAPAELHRWRAATDQLLRSGLFRNGEDAVDGD